MLPKGNNLCITTDKFWMIKLRLKAQGNNISVILGLLPERERDKRMGETKRPQPTPKFTSEKQISSCQQAKYDRAISLKTSAESAPPYHRHVRHKIVIIFLLILYTFFFETVLLSSQKIYFGGEIKELIFN